jgi:hypothetical protein
MNQLQREQVRVDSIDKQLILVSEYQKLAETYRIKGKHKQAQQMTRSAERCQRYADFLAGGGKK